MGFHRNLITLISVIALSGFVSDTVWADGCFMPQIVSTRIPGIPAQRALLSYRDGVERLVIESQVDGNGAPLAWIIPVPNEPTEVKSVSPSLLDYLSTRYGVVSRGTLSEWIYYNLTPLRFMIRHKGKAAGDSVEVIKEISLKDWTVAILKADEPEALNEWLGANGYLSFPPKANPILSDYIARKWVFVAAKCDNSRREDGRDIPDHIGLTFASSEPVYPMKLTGLSGADLFLELFVVADYTARARHLTLESSTGIRRGQSVPAADTTVEADFESYLWGDCQISKLTGKFSPRKMKTDIVLKLTPRKNHLKSVMEPEPVWKTALAPPVALLSWVILPPAMLVAGAAEIFY